MHIQYWDSHGYYTHPKEYMEQWHGSTLKAFPDEATIKQHQSDSFPRSATFLHWGANRVETMPDQIRNRDDFAHLVNGYDGAIRYLDDHARAYYGNALRDGDRRRGMLHH